MWAIAVVLVLALIVTARSIIVIPADKAYVVERLGRYNGTLTAGMHVLMPFVDRVAFRFSLQPSETELSDTAITLDNVLLTITSRVRSLVIDPERAAYAAADYATHVAAAVKSEQRNWIAARNENVIRDNTRELEADVARAAAAIAEQAGTRIEDLSVLRIERAGPA